MLNRAQVYGTVEPPTALPKAPRYASLRRLNLETAHVACGVAPLLGTRFYLFTCPYFATPT